MALGTARQALQHEGRVWTEATNQKLVHSLDTNKDGLISCEEFVNGFIGAKILVVLC